MEKLEKTSWNRTFYNAVYRKRSPVLYYLRRRFLSFDQKVKSAAIFAKCRPSKRKVLEIGFGSGVILMEMSKRNTVVGVEISDAAIKGLKGVVSAFRRRNVQLVKSSGDNKFPISEQFDVIVSSHVMEHVPDEASFVSEIYRLLGVEGELFLQVPIEENLFPVTDPNHVRNYTPESLRAVITDSGFDIKETILSGRSQRYLGVSRSRTMRLIVKAVSLLLPSTLFIKLESFAFGKFRAPQALVICTKKSRAPSAK